jgi:DNA-binding MarR family transcriptional regulator
MANPTRSKSRSDQRDDELNEALWLFSTAFRTIIKVPNEILERHNLGRIHHRTLFVIVRSQAISVGDLALKLGVSRQALQAPMRQLRTAGLIESVPLSTNRTVLILSPTPAGIKLEEEVTRIQRDYFARAFASVGPEAEAHWKEATRAIIQG